MPRRAARVRLPPSLSEVTRRAHEDDPHSAGLSRDGIAAIWQAVERLYGTALYPAISLCMRRRGRVVLDRSIGHSHGNSPADPADGPKTVCTPGTPMCIFSASKAITAMLIHLLDDRGVVHVDDRVCEYIPEFGRHGKQWITLRHLLTHRAGIPQVGGAEDVELLYQWDNLIAKLCEARPVSRPGRRVQYHAISGGFVLGEVVRRATGRPIAEVLRSEILDPLGFDTLGYGIAPERMGEVAINASTGPPVPFPASLVARNALGVSFEKATEISNTEAWLGSVVPSGNVVGTANELSRFYQLLLEGGALDGVRIMDDRTVRRARNETAYLELDFTLAMPVRYGTGLMLGAEWLGPFGPRSRNAFGHLGFINIFGWADPDRELSVGLLTTGKPFLSSHLIPLAALVARIARVCRP